MRNAHSTSADVSTKRYLLAGGSFGFLFPLLAWAVDLRRGKLSLSPHSLWRMHCANPLHWIIDTAPLILGLFAQQLGHARRLQEDIRREHDFIDLVLTTVDCCVLVVDCQGRIVRFNAACEQVTGYTASEVIGHPVWERFLDPAARAHTKEHWVNIRQATLPQRDEQMWTTKTGAQRLIAWSKTALRDGVGNCRYVLWTGIDITEQRQLEQQRDTLLQQLHEQAMTDPLTGIANRRHFIGVAAEQVQQAHTLGNPVSAVIFDIDHFKYINDTYGHAVGDEVLRIMVDRCRNQLREHDLFGRYGGEEFALVLPNTPLSVARQIAERLRVCVASEPFSTSGGDLCVTVSGGVAQTTSAIDSLGHLIDVADRALYCAKHTGRNCIAVG